MPVPVAERETVGDPHLSGFSVFSSFKKTQRGDAQKSFFQQWLTGVCDCIGFGWCKRLIGDHGKLVVTPQGGLAGVEIEDGKRLESLPPIELAPSDQVSGGSRLYVENSGKRQVVLRIPKQKAVRRNVNLPAAVAENLDRVIPGEIDRLTPFAVEQIFYDFFTKPTERGTGMLDIDLALTTRSSIEPWVERLTELGIKPQVIDIEEGWPGQNLLPHTQRERKKRGSFVTLLLFILVIALAGVALGIPLYQKREIVLALGDAERAAQKRANQVVALRTTVTESLESSRRVSDKRLKALPVVEVIGELTHLMPDDTWVQNMDIKDEKIQLRGETSQASALIGLLEASKMFRDVAFSSPVVQVPRSGKERFHLSANLELGGQ